MIDTDILRYKIMTELLEYGELLRFPRSHADKPIPTMREITEKIIKHVEYCHYVTQEEHTRQREERKRKDAEFAAELAAARSGSS